MLCSILHSRVYVKDVNVEIFYDKGWQIFLSYEMSWHKVIQVATQGKAKTRRRKT